MIWLFFTGGAASLLGVHPDMYSGYEGILREGREVFICDPLNVASMIIPIAAVNDDFCDCPNGRDEPGTSACSHISNSQFTCRSVTRTIPSSRVGDNICDCCEGDDEEAGKCPNTCTEELDATRKAEEARRQYLTALLEEKRLLDEEAVELWRKLQSDLIGITTRIERLQETLDRQLKMGTCPLPEYAISPMPPDDDVDYVLEARVAIAEDEMKRIQLILHNHFDTIKGILPYVDSCVSDEVGDFHYNICLLSNITQIHRTHRTLIGNFEVANTQPLSQLYTGGDLCPGRLARSANLTIACGAHDGRITVSEKTRCVYQIHLSLLGMCSDEELMEIAKVS